MNDTDILEAIPAAVERRVRLHKAQRAGYDRSQVPTSPAEPMDCLRHKGQHFTTPHLRPIIRLIHVVQQNRDWY